MLKQLDCKIENILNTFQSVSVLFARVLVAYGFYEPAMNKWSDMESVASWFGTLGIPFPLLNAYASASTEILGVILLTLGLFTRYISVALIVVMLVAIVTVHLPHGFSAGENGFEIPLYYISFLFIFVTFGAKKISLDAIWRKKDL